MVAGLAVFLIALLGLGTALTPTPVPQEGAALRTSGIYAVVRHPIYVGILVAALGFALAVGSIWQVVLWRLWPSSSTQRPSGKTACWRSATGWRGSTTPTM